MRARRPFRTVATRATNQASDKRQAVVMIEAVIANTGSSSKGGVHRHPLLLSEGS